MFPAESNACSSHWLVGPYCRSSVSVFCTASSSLVERSLLAQQVEALGFVVAGLHTHRSQELAGSPGVVSAAFLECCGECDLHLRTACGTHLVDESAIRVNRVGVVPGFEQQIGASAALTTEPVIPNLCNSLPAASASRLLGKLK